MTYTEYFYRVRDTLNDAWLTKYTLPSAADAQRQIDYLESQGGDVTGLEVFEQAIEWGRHADVTVPIEEEKIR